MKVGTKSVLFGIHHWWWHFYYCVRAWRWLYGRWPRLSEGVAIFLHDFGYIGCPNMDGREGSNHPMRISRLVHILAGQLAGDLVLKHSHSLCMRWDWTPSMLCWADKLATALWLEERRGGYLRRALHSGELAEYRQRAADSGFYPAEYGNFGWARKLATHVRNRAVLGPPSVLLSCEARKARLELKRGAA